MIVKKIIFSLLISSVVCHCGFGQEADSLYTDADTAAVNRRNFAFYPGLSASPETGVEFGLVAFFVFDDKIKDGMDRPSSITPAFIYTTKNQMTALVDVDYYFKNGDNVFSTLRYSDFPDRYFGEGPLTNPEVSDDYRDRFFELEGRFVRPRNQHLFYGLYYDFQYNDVLDVDDQSTLANDQPIGINGGWTMGVGPGFEFDTRNNTLYPTHGKLINLGVTFYSQAFGSDYNYQQYVLDYRHYFEVFGPKNILAYQFNSTLTTGDDVPFYKLNRIGGNNRLRGLGHRNLYRDRQSMFFQVEGRQELFWRFGGVLFAGLGQVFDELSNFDMNNTRFVYGFGGRFQALEGQRMNIRLDVGFSDEGQSAFYISVREAF